MNIIEEFISYLYDAVDRHSIYVWGAQGKTGSQITEKWIRSREKKNGERDVNRALSFWRKQVEAGYGDVLSAYDCSGLICAFFQNKKHILKYDHNANGLMSKCEIGKTKQAGYLVFRVNDKGQAVHVGAIVKVYDDGSYDSIHAKGRDVGVVLQHISKSSTYWHRIGRPKFVDKELFQDGENEPLNKPTEPQDEPGGAYVFTRNMRRGTRGKDVEELKKLLIKAGYSAGVTVGTPSSKTYGPATALLVAKYQKDHGLVVDGIAGSNTIGSLGGVYKK